MGINTKENYRQGSVRDREQTYNPTTGLYGKRNANTGKYMSNKKTGGCYKGVAKYSDGRRRS